MTDVELDTRVTVLEENVGGFLNGETYIDVFFSGPM